VIRQVWAFNFIQIPEIAENNPELLTLVVSVREGTPTRPSSFRVNLVRVDFYGRAGERGSPLPPAAVSSH
jgi:hypothetical protein